MVLFGTHVLSLSAETLPSGTKKGKSLTDFSVVNAVVYVPLGDSQTTTAFFTFKNNTAKPITITKVASSVIQKIELSPPVSPAADAPNAWTIAAHQTLVLNPTSQHLQLSGLKSSLRTGDELQLELSLSTGKKLLVIAKAKSAFDQTHGH